MASTIVLRLSARTEILWHFHVVLDSVPEGRAGQREFAKRILVEFGIAQSQLEESVRQVCAKLPEDLHDVEMDDLMKAFEEAVPVEWYDDMIKVDVELVAEFEAGVLRILAERTPAQLPKQLTGQVLQELERTLGSSLDQTLLQPLREALEDTFVRELWRSKDKAAQERLKDSVLYYVGRFARLDFGRGE